jgi:hypothetical protein
MTAPFPQTMDYSGHNLPKLGRDTFLSGDGRVHT